MAAVIHMRDTFHHSPLLEDHLDEVTWFAHDGDGPEHDPHVPDDLAGLEEAMTARRRAEFAALADL